MNGHSGSDNETFKARDASSFDGIADRFDRFADRYSSHLPSQFIAMARPEPHERVLDVGTGTGIVALGMAAQTEFRHAILGIDLSAGMLAKARLNAEQLGLAGRVEFLQMDAESLALDDDLLDLVVSLYTLRHLPDPLGALKEMFRVLRPGGRMVVAVGSGVPLLTTDGLIEGLKRLVETSRKLRGRRLTACDYLETLIDRYIPQSTAPEVPAWAGGHTHFAGSVPALAKRAGFADIKHKWIGHQAVIDGAEEFWDLQTTLSTKVKKRLDGAAREDLRALRVAFMDQCARVQRRGGTLVYPTGALFVCGHRTSD